MRQVGSKGFTIVELLVVIVVIAILAAISIAAYSGIQDRATDAAISSNLDTNRKQLQLRKAESGKVVTASEVAGSSGLITLDKGLYTVSGYCSTETSFVLAVRTKKNKVFYVRDGGGVTRNDAINAANPCESLGVRNADNTAAARTHPGMSATACASENTTCTFSGQKSIAYGSLAQGVFIIRESRTSPVFCNNATFTDPIPGHLKACYVVDL